MPEIDKAIEPEAKSLSVEASSFAITDAVTYTGAGGLWDTIKAMRARIAEVFDPIINKAHLAHKEAVGQKKKLDDPLEQAQRGLKQKMIVYDQRQAAIARKKQLELEAAEKKRAEEEALEIAQLLHNVGDKEAAEELLNKPVETAPIRVIKETPKVTGFSYRTIYKIEVLNVAQALEDWRAGNVPLEAFRCDESYLREAANHYKEAWVGKFKWLKVWGEKV